MNTTVIGTGGWGTALALILHGNGHRVTLWGRMAAEVDPILAHRENRLFLPGAPIPADLTVTGETDAALAEAELVVLAVPSHGMRPICEQIQPHLPANAVLAHVAKGIECDSCQRMSTVINEVLGHGDVVVLSGPSHAEEVARGVPTAVVVAAADAARAAQVQEAFMNDRFRIYTHDDVAGVELGGALKNVIAIAAGVCDGIGFGDNTKAALCTRGLAEMARLGVACGARQETFFGLSGLGDLVVTAFSAHSRNRSFGERLGQGESAQAILDSTKTVAEGVRTARSLHQLAATSGGIEMPIAAEVYAIVYDGKPPRDAVRDLMNRDAKPEFGP